MTLDTTVFTRTINAAMVAQILGCRCGENDFFGNEYNGLKQTKTERKERRAQAHELRIVMGQVFGYEDTERGKRENAAEMWAQFEMYRQERIAALTDLNRK